MARKGRARRFREARELKQMDDGLFKENERSSLADVWDPAAEAPADAEDDDFDDFDDESDDDEYDPLDH